MDILVSVAGEGSVAAPRVLDVSRMAGSALSTGRSPSCICGPGFGSSPPSASLPSKICKKTMKPHSAQMKQGYGKSYEKKKGVGNISEESTQHLDLLGFLQNPPEGGVGEERRLARS